MGTDALLQNRGMEVGLSRRDLKIQSEKTNRNDGEPWQSAVGSRDLNREDCKGGLTEGLWVEWTQSFGGCSNTKFWAYGTLEGFPGYFGEELKKIPGTLRSIFRRESSSQQGESSGGYRSQTKQK